MLLIFFLTIDLLAINDNLLYISISTKQPGKFSINCALHGRKKAVFESPFSWLPIILKKAKQHLDIIKLCDRYKTLATRYIFFPDDLGYHRVCL